MAAPHKDEKKREPEWIVRLPEDHGQLKRQTPFVCNIRFKNDLPEIPCDPKLLLPPFDKEQLAAFKLTELEKDLRKDLLFDADLGIPIHPWNIEQYSIPEVVPPLHPDDAALLQSDEETEPKRARLRGDAAEVSWLLRTKYIAAEAGLRRGGGQQAKAAAAPQGEEENEDPREARVRQIEAQFAAAREPPVHGKDPSLTPLEVLPVFPDFQFEGRSCVLATFDADPLADCQLAETLPQEQRGRLPQAMQLKSFKPQAGPQFVALLVPRSMPQPGEDALSQAGGIPGPALAREYTWVREYQPTPRLDDKSTTFLFRFTGDGTVTFHDLNTRLELRKRKRGAAAEGEEGDAFVQPEMVVVRRSDTGEYAEQAQREAEEEQRDQEHGRQQNGAAGAADDEQQLQEQQQREQDGSEEDGGMAEVPAGDSEDAAEQPGEDADGGVAASNAALRDVFGDDDDDI